MLKKLSISLLLISFCFSQTSLDRSIEYFLEGETALLLGDYDLADHKGVGTIPISFCGVSNVNG